MGRILTAIVLVNLSLNPVNSEHRGNVDSGLVVIDFSPLPESSGDSGYDIKIAAECDGEKPYRQVIRIPAGADREPAKVIVERVLSKAGWEVKGDDKSQPLSSVVRSYNGKVPGKFTITAEGLSEEFRPIERYQPKVTRVTPKSK